MRQNPDNPYRWVVGNEAFYPLGLQDCTPGNGVKDENVLSYWGFDGGVSPNYGIVDLDTYLTAHRNAGFNFYRWSIGNCSFRLNNEFNRLQGDILINKLKQYGFRVQLVFFNNIVDTSPAGLAYVNYVINRYTNKVDIWEVSNESQSSDADLIFIADYIRANDPNRHPVTTSLNYASSQSRLVSGMDILSPHRYTDATEFSVDLEMANNLSLWKQYNKPVIIGEYGWRYINYDSTTDTKARLSLWSALFNEGSLIFWNTSYATDYAVEGASNAYLGSVARSYVRVLANFMVAIPKNAEIVTVNTNSPNSIRRFGLTSTEKYFVYLHAFTNHTTPTSNITVTINVPTTGTATWINPSTGSVLGTQSVLAGVRTLNVPSFLIDVALKID
jgi:hypothetical protein